MLRLLTLGVIGTAVGAFGAPKSGAMKAMKAMKAAAPKGKYWVKTLRNLNAYPPTHGAEEMDPREG